MGKPVLLWEPCYSLGKKPHRVGCTKSKDRILLADLVCFEVQCLQRSAHLKIFLILAFWSRRFKSAYPFLNYFIFTSASSCLSSSLLPSSFVTFCLFFLHLSKKIFYRKCLCFLVSLFPCVTSYRWIHFPRSVVSVLSTSPVLVYSFLRKRMFSFIFMKSHG